MEIKLLEYKIGTGARAFSTMRGEGSGNYDGFNITHYCGDAPGTSPSNEAMNSKVSFTRGCTSDDLA